MSIKCPKCHFDNPEDTIYCGKCATRLDSTPQISVTRTLETTPDELARGSLFAGRYEIIEELGAGGMGRVYRAFDKKIDEEVALKLIKPEIAAEGRVVERFRNELKTARKIRHKNVCGMYDFHEEEKTVYLTMEYVRGENLKSLIHRMKSLTIDAAISTARQIAEGLDEAHKLGIIHRDLKPGNIMIDKDGNAKIMDFGIARVRQEKGITGEGAVIGTPEYMSPEQVEGKPADARSDIYALGAILFEMVTGRPPFEGDTPMSVAHKHRYEPAPDPQKLNPQLPGGLKRIILRSLEKAREKRYQTTEEFLAEIAAVEEGLPRAERTTGKRKPVTSREITVKLTPKKLLVPAGVLIAIAAIIFGLLKFLPRNGPPTPSLRRIPLAVMYAVNNSGDKSLDSQFRWQIPYYLSMDLAQSKYLNVLPQDRLMQILEDIKRMDEEHHLSKTLDRIANTANVAYFVLPSFTKTSDNFWLSFTIRKANTDEALGEPDIVKGKGPEDLFPMVAEISLKVKSRLNLSSEEIASDQGQNLDKITTTSPEALGHYIEAQKFYAQSNYAASLQSLEKAVKEDPNFAMAYLKMAIDYDYIGDLGKSREYLQKAMTLADRVGERDRYFIQAHSSYLLDESPLRAIDGYQKLIELNPQDEESRTALGAIRRNIEEWDLALEQFDEVLSYNPKSSLALENKIFIYTAKGWYEKAIELCESGRAISPEGAFFVSQLPLLYLIQGQYDYASSELEKASARLPDNLEIIELDGNLRQLMGDLATARRVYEQLQRRGEAAPKGPYVGGRFWLAQLLLLQGEYHQAQQGILEGIELAQKSNRVYDELDLRLLLAYSELQLKRFSRAADRLKPVLELSKKNTFMATQEAALHLSGLASLGMGRVEEAKRTSEQIRQLVERESYHKQMRRYDHLMGQIALAEGRTSQAVRNFEHAISLLPEQRGNFDEQAFYYDGLASACAQNGDLAKAAETYRAIGSLTTGRLRWGDIYARSFYWLGKIHEQLGDKKEAIENYQKFLGIWKDADPGLPEVEDAKKRLAELKG